MEENLPVSITENAFLRGNEYGWRITDFLRALEKAQALEFACLGGQFQFRLVDGGTFEMYWLAADSTERGLNEEWSTYCTRSCSEVREKFQRLVESTDFRQEATNLNNLKNFIEERLNLTDLIFFVAYFVSEAEYVELSLRQAQ
jgi:hypothetical protein